MNETWWVRPEDLKPEQREAVQLSIDDSHLITGPPGCGKTNLLLLRANYLVRAGRPNVLIIVFNRTLQEFVSSGGQQYSFAPNKVTTFQRWGMRLLHEYGVHFEPTGGFKEQRVQLMNQLKTLISSHRLAGLYDCVLIDEAQDLLPDEVNVLKQVSRTIFAVADRRQKIYTGDDSVETLQRFVSRETTLRYHYRCGMNICKLADAIARDSDTYEPLEPTCQYIEVARPSSVEEFTAPSFDDQCKMIVSKLQVQRKAYPDEMLGVVCPRRNMLPALWGHIARSSMAPEAVIQGGSEGYFSFNPGTRICICTIHSIKGLEVRALHIAGCDGLRGMPYVRRMAYMAVTRAKTSLSIYRSGDMLGFLESALASLKPACELPAIEDVF
jgi:superfamily I DNA/RNA helicase